MKVEDAFWRMRDRVVQTLAMTLAAEEVLQNIDERQVACGAFNGQAMTAVDAEDLSPMARMIFLVQGLEGHDEQRCSCSEAC